MVVFALTDCIDIGGTGAACDGDIIQFVVSAVCTV